MNARWRTVTIGVLVPALVTGGIALAGREDSGRQSDRDQRRAEGPPGHRGGPLGMGLLRKLTYAELHIRENGEDKLVRVDRGRLESASQSEITLKENDGQSVTVAVDDDTRVLAGRFRFGASRDEVTDIRRGRVVIAAHERGKPAILVAAPRRMRWRRHFRMGPDHRPHMGFRERGERR